MKTSLGQPVVYVVGPFDEIGRRHPTRIGEKRAAVIVNAWDGAEDAVAHPNLAILGDGDNDRLGPAGFSLIWVTSVLFGTEPGQWQWPEGVAVVTPAPAPATPAP